MNFVYDGKVSDICPLKLIKQETQTYMTLYTWFMESNRNTLPFPGCLLQQPEKIMSIFSVIEDAKMRTKEERDQSLTMLGGKHVS